MNVAAGQVRAEANAETLQAIRRALDENPDGVLEMIAEARNVPLRAVLDCLPPESAMQVPAEDYERIWQELTTWGPVVFLVHSAGGVFEMACTLPPGSHGRGYFNIHGDSPLGGHLKMSRCVAIYFIDRPFFKRRSCSVQFINADGQAMFKVFVARDEERNLKVEQLARYEALRNSMRAAG